MKASKASNPQIRRHLLWDFDIEKFDYSKSERLVIERVIERGTQAEWREIIRFYGKAKIREVAKKSKQLDSKNRNFTFIYLDSIFKDSEIILPETWSLLQAFQNDEQLSDFFLVGGTALALQIGHRFSIDLDMFSLKSFDNQLLEQHLQIKYEFVSDYVATNTLKGFVKDIKVDFLTHAYTMVEPIQVLDGVRMASNLDIGAMKLSAIAHNIIRQKDFYDIYFLLEKFSLNVLLVAYQNKYPSSNALIPHKGLAYFDDINFENEKPVLRKKITFSGVKKRLVDALKNPTKLF